MLAFTNIFQTIWSFLETSFSLLVKAYNVFIQTIALSAAPFRMFGHAIGSFNSIPVVTILTVIAAFSVVVTVYRIFRGNF